MIGATAEDALAPPKLRRTSARCILCNVVLECPDDADVWAWVKTQAVADFLKVHDHGGPRCAAVEIVREDEDEEQKEQ